MRDPHEPTKDQVHFCARCDGKRLGRIEGIKLARGRVTLPNRDVPEFVLNGATSGEVVGEGRGCKALVGTVLHASDRVESRGIGGSLKLGLGQLNAPPIHGKDRQHAEQHNKGRHRHKEAATPAVRCPPPSSRDAMPAYRAR